MLVKVELLHRIMGISDREAAEIIAEVSATFREGKYDPKDHVERIKEIEKRFEGKKLSLALFHLGFETAMRTTFVMGINEIGVFDPGLCGSFVAIHMKQCIDRSREARQNKKELIKKLEKEFKELEEKKIKKEERRIEVV